MTFLSRMTIGTVLALAIAGLFGAVRAAEPAAPAAHHGPAQMCGDMDARMAGRLAYAEAKLGLNDAQKAQFKTLSETMKAANEPVRKACADLTAQPAATTLPARLESMQKMMTARTEALGKVVPAVTQFYKGLTPDQQKIADTTLMGGHRGAMGHRASKGHWNHDGGGHDGSMMQH